MIETAAKPPAATAAVEDYLKCILQAGQRDPRSTVSTGTIASRLQVAPGSVTAMLKTLAARGLVEYQPYSGVRLSPEGSRVASGVLRRHRLLELFLVEVVGLDWSEVHREAERLEHAVSERLIERIDVMLGRPELDPHGDPIPGAGALAPLESLPTLATAACERRLQVARIDDQRADFLRWVERRGLTPGCELRILRRDDVADTATLRLATGDELEVGLRAAAGIQVRTLG